MTLMMEQEFNAQEWRTVQGKWRLLYHALDVNHDGVVSRADSIKCISDLEKHYKNRLDKSTLKRLLDALNQYWEYLIFGKAAHQSSVTEEEFVASLTKEFQNDPDGLRKVARETITQAVMAVDVNSNGKISYDEYSAILIAFGHRDQVLLRQLFDAFGTNENDEVEMQPYLQAWIDFYLGEEQEKRNIAVDAFANTAI